MMTTTKLTPEELAAIRERHGGAVLGPMPNLSCDWNDVDRLLSHIAAVTGERDEAVRRRDLYEEWLRLTREAAGQSEASSEPVFCFVKKLREERDAAVKALEAIDVAAMEWREQRQALAATAGGEKGRPLPEAPKV